MTADDKQIVDDPKKSQDNTDTTSATSVVSATGQKSKHIEWSPENETILVEWCDAAQCYKWLNTRSHINYSYMHAWFTIPAITLSTISGTASFAQASLPVAYQTYAPMVIGSLNIFIGILTTVQQYLKISELNEAHRVSAISWDKFARNIRIELSKAPNERMDAGQFIKLCRQEYDRLMETSPSVKESVITEFEKAFKGKEGSMQRKLYEELKKPDICNIIISANQYRHPWYLEESTQTYMTTDSTDNTDLKDLYFLEKEKEILEKENKIKQKEEEELEKKEKKDEIRKMFQKSVVEMSNKLKLDMKQIDDYSASFLNMYGRKPILDEIKTHAEELVQSGKIDKQAAKKYLDKFNVTNIMDIMDMV